MAGERDAGHGNGRHQEEGACDCDPDAASVATSSGQDAGLPGRIEFCAEYGLAAVSRTCLAGSGRSKSRNRHQDRGNEQLWAEPRSRRSGRTSASRAAMVAAKPSTSRALMRFLTRRSSVATALVTV